MIAENLMFTLSQTRLDSGNKPTHWANLKTGGLGAI